MTVLRKCTKENFPSMTKTVKKGHASSAARICTKERWIGSTNATTRKGSRG